MLKDRGLTRISTTSIHLQNTAMLSDIQNVGDLSEMLSVRKRTIERDIHFSNVKKDELVHEGKR